MKRILVIEDDELIREELGIMLGEAEYHVLKIVDFHNVTEQILNLSPDLLLLDLNLPNESGFQICKRIKNKSCFPILVLTSCEQLKVEIQALELGADEYLTKPFRKERLLARIQNLLRRYEGRANFLERDNILLDRKSYTLYIDGDSVVLPQNQGRLLEVFFVSDSKIVSKEELSMALWGSTEFIDENALQVNMTRLRKVMKKLGMVQQIETVRGLGYRLIEEPGDLAQYNDASSDRGSSDETVL